MLPIFMWYVHVLYQTKWKRNTEYIHVVWDEHLENFRCYSLNSKHHSCTVTQLLMPYVLEL